MRQQNIKIGLVGLLFSAGLIQGCSSYDPVDISECSKVVSHAKKVLGKLAPSSKEMMASCKTASDQDRGCIMASDKPMKISSCM